MMMPGIGPITATAMVAKIENVDCYKKAKDFAASLGLTPREYSSANTRRVGKISKQGDRYIRTLLIHGARSVLKSTARDVEHPNSYHRWIVQLVNRAGFNRAAVALANKHARMIWALIKHNTVFDFKHAEQYV